MVSCFKRAVSLSLLSLTLSCGQDGVAPLLGGNTYIPLEGDVTTYAGSAGLTGTTDGARTSARFNQTVGLAYDGTYLYVADSSNRTIRRINRATGIVDTVAGSPGQTANTDGTGSAARFSSIGNMLYHGGYLYISQYSAHTIRRMNTTTFEVTTVLGTAGASGTANGTGTAARFNGANGMATDGSYLYITELNNASVRKASLSTFTVTTLAGLTGTTGYADGPGTTARFRSTVGITYGEGSLWVIDQGSHTIRKVNPSNGTTVTIAGQDQVNSSTDGVGTAATFSSPQEIHYFNGALYIAEPGRNLVRRMVTSTLEVSLLAGDEGVAGDDDGLGESATFNFPTCMTNDGTSLYISDIDNSTVRKID